MPIYEYQCEACGHEFETLQKMSDDPLVDCPQCKAPKLRKLISAAAFRLKGQGWYETDFKKDNQKNLSQSESSSTGSGNSGTGKTESSSGGDAKQSTSTSTGKTESSSKPASSSTSPKASSE